MKKKRKKERKLKYPQVSNLKEIIFHPSSLRFVWGRGNSRLVEKLWLQGSQDSVVMGEDKKTGVVNVSTHTQ